MATHIVLVRFTEKGIHQIKQSPERAAAFADIAKGLGIKIEGTYWCSGGYDGVLLMDAPDDEAASVAALSLGRSGFVQTQTLRAFDRPQIESILARL